jgi:mycothiol synthase
LRGLQLGPRTLPADEDVNLGELTIVECPVDRLSKCLAWIHRGVTSETLAALTLDAQAKMRDLGGPLPLYAEQLGQPVAAAYFKRLPGQVATLGGVHAKVGFFEVAAQLVRQLNDALKNDEIPQIQAVIDVSDQSTAEIIQRCGFQLLTHVQHLYLDLSSTRASSDDLIRGVCDTEVPHGFHWLPASHFAKSRLEKLVAATFDGTLDCPALNELRDPNQVLEGMLDGREFRRLTTWEVLAHGRDLLGCVFLSKHPAGVAELAYMGLIPAARGQRLGRLLIARAIERSRTLNSNALIVAVDESNLPALKLYVTFGFSCQQQLSVWLMGG